MNNIKNKNQIGGVKLNADLTECLDQGDFKHYNFYKNECCKDRA